MNSIDFNKINVVMSEHHLRYGCKNVVNIDLEICSRLLKISFSNTAFVFTQHFTFMACTGTLKIASKLGLLFFFINKAGIVISLEVIITF